MRKLFTTGVDGAWPRCVDVHAHIVGLSSRRSLRRNKTLFQADASRPGLLVVTRSSEIPRQIHQTPLVSSTGGFIALRFKSDAPRFKILQ
ncbi:hypothetical protein EYF80_051038 [Liparis tanakae]|uniref:Uncharacterized protein n=1 Tax=Liparis tanakae TaxID=230148 RepID=A0A4Z2FC89_9TELE|nr:hypothetical protein EYF80_051038 [Liparis tanakae]